MVVIVRLIVPSRVISSKPLGNGEAVICASLRVVHQARVAASEARR